MKSSRLHTSSLAPRHLHGRCIMAEGAAEAAECPDVCVGREVLTDFTYLFKTDRQGRVPTLPKRYAQLPAFKADTVAVCAGRV